MNDVERAEDAAQKSNFQPVAELTEAHTGKPYPLGVPFPSDVPPPVIGEVIAENLYPATGNPVVDALIAGQPVEGMPESPAEIAPMSNHPLEGRITTLESIINEIDRRLMSVEKSAFVRKFI